MERTPESDADRAAPIVPDDKENAAGGWSISLCTRFHNEKGDPYKTYSAHNLARKSEQSKEEVGEGAWSTLGCTPDALTTRSISPGKRLCRAMLEHEAGV